ncbi:hypothetical protein RN001_015308 [Aquatica leii]|uniref:Craniofacial development protein 2-like n=1 Tax=Aquatica leii TaxID=1421715 RepID=A0AAN7NZ15_9COLE|nr:hypothetical protein RN001_015308 [Aquatica leii]
MFFGTWNVQGIATKKNEVFKELVRFNLDIIALSETKKKGKGYDIVVIAAYAPTDNASDAEKTDFFNSLTNLLDQVGSRKELYLLGDFNGRVGKPDAGKAVGRYGEDSTNDNGERLISMSEQYDLKIWNGFFQHKEIHKYTETSEKLLANARAF